MTDPLMRAAQALAILNALEQHVPAGGRVELIHTEADDLPWIVRYSTSDVDAPSMHRGESPTDALGQLTTVLTLDGGG